jgi:putative flippase GtrA
LKQKLSPEFVRYLCFLALVEASVWFISQHYLKEKYNMSVYGITIIVDTINLILGFIIKKLLVFKGERTKKTLKQFIFYLPTFFIFLVMTNLILSMLEMYTCIHNDTIERVISALILLWPSYFINKKIVFTKKK